MPKRLYITAFILVAGVAAFFYYSSLGGFQDAKIQQVDVDEILIYGTAYKGLPSDKEVKDIFDDIRLHLKEGSLKGEPTVCYFGNPDQDEYEIQLFVGIKQATADQPLPKGLEPLTLKSGKVMRAKINAYSIVAPSPTDINQMLKDKAKEQGLTTDSIFVEHYASEKEIWTDVFLK